MITAFQVWQWSQFLLIAQGLVFVFLLALAAFYAIKLGSTKAWKETAEQRKETILDMKSEIEVLEKRLVEAERKRKEADERSNEASQFNFELQGKLRLYERQFGALKPKDFDR